MLQSYSIFLHGLQLTPQSLGFAHGFQMPGFRIPQQKAELPQFVGQGVLAFSGGGQGCPQFGIFALSGFVLLPPEGFLMIPITALGCEGLAFDLLFGANLIEHGQQPRLASFTTLALGFEALPGFSELLRHIRSRLLQNCFSLSDTSGSFGADLGDGVHGRPNALLGGLNGGFGGGAAFLFHQEAIGEFAGDGLDGFEFAPEIASCGLSLPLLGDGDVAGLFGFRNRLGSGVPLFVEGGFGVVHGDFPERVQRGRDSFGNGWRQDDLRRFGQLLLPVFQVLADGGVAAGAEQFAHALDRRIEATSEQGFGSGSNFFVADSGTGHGIDGTSRLLMMER